MSKTLEVKIIRRELWKPNAQSDNSNKLNQLVHWINACFRYFGEIADLPMIWDRQMLIWYIGVLADCRYQYSCNLSVLPFEQLIDSVELVGSSKIIKAQWDNILDEHGGMETFVKVFDDVFTTTIQNYDGKFIYHFKDSDILTRCARVKEANERRFIPKPNVTNNRWNPPGKTYLYLAFKNQEVKNTPDGITGGQYICINECRIPSDTDVCFCDFVPVSEGGLLDLSYNEKPLYSYRMMLDQEANRSANESLSRLLNDPELFKHRDDKKYVQGRIRQDMNEHPVRQEILHESIAKMYLKGICDCIYTKVDDEDEAEKERTYKSFHILAEYLDSKGITGIIYPCTRLPGMPGKNAVLFNVADAKPVDGTVTQYHYA